ncbi:Spore Coat Protein U domain protein [Aquimixticola soesokkakensis]|uniref:Spore Coat Protein U domain protein n=1 Tax=Aquimixticola soesokkakensis TaxID=1519096 RepID=A0A1Y5SLM4_9RHOB|nr:spore coat U domain-containing protein [Aquimixticola soesokkakensis]SLN43253.1 Spore Coat Protein U domain protein [Aquimixticola soesokkakensis]
MKRTFSLLPALAGALVLAGPAHAAETATSNLAVSAIVADTCTIATGTALSFATLDTSSISSEITPGLVTVICTASRSGILVTVDGGDNAASGVRRMATSDGETFLPYSIMSDSGHASEISVGGELYNDGVTAAVPQIIPVYGQIPAGNYAAGNYSDTLEVTLSY